MHPRDVPPGRTVERAPVRGNGHDTSRTGGVACSACGFESPGSLAFCGVCGTKLARECARCGAESPPGLRFCGHCGAALAVVPAAPARAAAAEGERRHVTVVFCDLVGSTALSERLDPETMRELVRDYQTVCSRVTARFDGSVGQYLGDGVVLHFGYPRAHEDDAQRAIRTALGILDGMRELNLQRGHAPRLAVRVGLHSGLVVVGEIGAAGERGPVGIVGETPNVAARLQAVAEPDTIVVSEATHALVRGFFEVADLGMQSLKGFSAPLRAYRVIGETAARSRLEIVAPGGFTPLVGREHETSLLLDRWEQVKIGFGQVVLLGGEAGIGKSRLVEVVRARVASEPHTWLECRGSPYHANSALFPVIELVHRLLRCDHDDPPDERLARLEELVARFRVPAAEAIPLLAETISLPCEHRHPPLEMTPQRRRQRTLEIMLEVLLELAAERPLVLFVDDLHWVDPSTLELLGMCIDQGPTARILTLLTSRPEFVSPWRNRSYVTQVTVARLPRAHAERMVTGVAGDRALPPEVVAHIVAKTDGVPLFVEELTKTVLESGLLHESAGRLTLVQPLRSLAIPATLQDSLMARLDRLSPVRDVAQIAASLGREFRYDLLRALTPLDEADLRHELARLVEGELLYQRGTPPGATYVFKHALIQEAAYESMLRAKRRQVHRHIAEVLLEQFAEIAETQPEVVAHHWTEGTEPARAVFHWQLAALRATQRSAHQESLAFTARGLALLGDLPDGPERMQQELMLHMTAAVPLIALRGYAAPDTEATFARARELCQQLGDPDALFPVLRGLWEFYVVRGMSSHAHGLATQLLAMARDADDPDQLLEAHFALGETCFYLGDLAAAEHHLAEAIARYNPAIHRGHAYVYGEDPGVLARSYAAWTAWYLGAPDRALALMDEAIALAEDGRHSFTLALTFDFAAVLHQLRGEPAAAQAWAERDIALSTEQGFPLWTALAHICRGWARVRTGERDAGVSEMRDGLTAWRATGTELGMPFVLALLAEAALDSGRVDEAATAVRDAFTALEKSGERHHEAELHRLQARLLLAEAACTRAADAEASLRRALTIAQARSNRAHALRAAISLAQLLDGGGRRADARAVLADAYGRFTEGFETEDLERARVLLAHLA